MDPLETIQNGSLSASLFYDTDVPNPREEWEHFGTIWGWHKREEWTEPRAKKMPWYTNDVQETHRRFMKWAKAECVLFLPVYLLQHSGSCVSTTPFNDPWDSGQVGFIYVTREDVLNLFEKKKLTAEIRAKALNMLVSEIDELNEYFSGDVYRYVIEDNGVEIVSLSGYYGYAFAVSQMKESLDYAADNEWKNMFTEEVKGGQLELECV